MIGEVLSILGLLLSSAAATINVLHGYIKTETLVTGSDNYFAVYNHQLTNFFESYTLDNELKCRYLAMAINYTVASVEVRPTGTGSLECRISSKGIKDGIILTQKEGTHTYIKVQTADFFPASDGLFYDRVPNVQMNCPAAMTACPATSKTRLPATRTPEAKRIVRDIASLSSTEKVCVGAWRSNGGPDSSPFYWYDTAQQVTLDVPIVGYNGADALAFTKDSEYSKTEIALHDFVCVYKIFDFNWP